MDKLKGTKCFDDGCDSSGSLDLESCVDGTDEQCTLSQGEFGCQKVAIENAKRHAADVDISLESQNHAVEYDLQDSLSFSCDENIIVGPHTMGSNTRIQFSVSIKKSDQTKIVQVSDETLAVTTEFEYNNSSRGRRSGPKAHPQIGLK